MKAKSLGSCSELGRLLQGSGSCCGSYAWSRNVWSGGEVLFAEAAPAAAGDASGGASGGASASTSFSGTNNQVAGVDEADVTKTDGRFVYSVSSPLDWGSMANTRGEGVVHIVDTLPTDSMAVAATLHVEAETGARPRQLLLESASPGTAAARLVVIAESRFQVATPLTGAESAAVMATGQNASLYYARSYGAPYYSSSGGGENLPPPWYSFAATTVLVYDLSDVRNPQLVRRTDTEGYLVAARRLQGQVVLVTRAYPRYYLYGQLNNPDFVQNVTVINGTSVREPSPAQLLPLTREVDVLAVGRRRTVAGQQSAVEPSFEPVCGCSAVTTLDGVLPNNFISVTSVPLAGGVGGVQRATVAGNGHTVFVGHRSLFAASSNYNWAAGESTGVLAFDIEHLESVGPQIRGSFSVPGSLLNQFSMDEWMGSVRVATTIGGWWASQPSTNNIFIHDADTLEPQGALRGLAPGERIYSVRFLGPKAHVVTFRQVDPLFVIDVADPSAPAVLGQLKVPGFSSYLHPVNDTHLLGLGRDVFVTPEGWNRQGGVKLSLFNVRNVSQPLEEATIVIGNASTQTEAQHNHLAFYFQAAASDRGPLVSFPIALGRSWQRPGTTWVSSSVVWSGAVALSLHPGEFRTEGYLSLDPSHPTATPAADQLAWAAKGQHSTAAQRTGWQWSYPYAVSRVLSIDDGLYCVSPAAVGAYNLTAAAGMTENGSLPLIGRVQVANESAFGQSFGYYWLA